MSVAPNDAPVPTCLRLDPTKPTEIRYVMAVVAIPEGFGRVTHIEFGRIIGEHGHDVTLAVDPGFLNPDGA